MTDFEDDVQPPWWAESVEEGRKAEAKTVPPNTDAVRVLAEAMHTVQCLPGANPYHRYSDGHREPELRRAALILAAVKSDGYVVVRREVP